MRTYGSVDVSPWTEGISARVSLDALIVLIAKRLLLGVDVAAAKFVTGGQIEDPIREGEILDWVSNKTPDGFGYEARMAFFRDQITANKAIQRGLHDHWRDNPADIPTRWHGATEKVRPRLDAVNRHMLVLLPYIPHLSQEQLSAAGDLLDLTLSSSPHLRQFGDIRRTAGRTALRSLGDAG
jgi:chorismate mutase-like protein